jgi:hypothetical protein
MYKAKGTFQAQELVTRDGNKGPYKVGDAIFEIDQSYEDNRTGEMVKNIQDVPFNVIGRNAEFVETLVYGQECEISFEISGRENKGRHYSSLRVFTIKPIGEVKAKAPDLEF